ncbi:hypothetical protein A1O1_08015 [Capronia coronata CBS 617.96]|uniref:Pre-rRNA-processing protein IPI3 n=1 Tax=Capronia coronata CBS 617.96 TaxID=1182541 RepID=W9XP22_9EURO|nr:uncharacterized protein A1O1_08015 [Capronia coronata CBS 617.96]EXJ81948.1 hypothetical protein A1O1_08015 [Capronia coronata CBS 617.96]
MLTESFLAATLTANKVPAHMSAALKDVGIFLHEVQPQNTFRQGYKKSSTRPGCVAFSDSHVFAAQADKAVVNVYSRDRGNQEATVPFPERIHSLVFARAASILVLGTEGGKLILWEVSTGRVTTSTAAHLQPVSSLCITSNDEFIISASADTSVHVWSLARLVSFMQPGGSYRAEDTSKSPIRTFSGHRTAVTAAACGHSDITTNFAVTCSEDGTCYIWDMETGQILRTLLLPTVAMCIAVDPADRVVYFGCKDGQIHAWDIFRQSGKSSISNPESAGTAPIQILTKDAWAAPAKDIGAANCLTLSYDGTSLLSGHSNGVVIRWDVAKHRILNEVANLVQPVTNIEMLKPTGFANQKRPEYTILNVVKPNLEFTSSSSEIGTCGVSAKYHLNIMINDRLSTSKDDDIEAAITGPGIPGSLLNEALRELVSGSVSGHSSSVDDAQKFKVESLEEEVSKLKQQIAVFRDVEGKRKEKRLKRMMKRENIDAKMREAYFEAVKKGKDGDAAMKKWQQQKATLDAESDQDYLADKMDLT